MTKSKDNLDISVIITTYNRAEMLLETLERMTHLDRDGLSVEFVIVNNNSSDHTKDIVDSFSERLPVRYLFEPRPGKNCALNKVLDEVELGKLIVFTDDDVEPQEDWLKAIISVCRRWPDYSVFGGKIYLVMPEIEVPYWNVVPHVPGLCFGAHGLDNIEQPFPVDRFPAGANFWLRSKILTKNRRFDEFFGPRPRNRIMASESSFAKKLIEDGYKILYSPSAVVGHRILPEMLTLSSIKQRVYRSGRTSPHLWGLKPLKLYEKHRFFWFLWRTLALIKSLLAYLVAMVSFSKAKRLVRSLKALNGIAYNIESLRIAYSKFDPQTW